MLMMPPLGAEAQALVETIRALARDRFTGRAARYDAESSFPTENYADLRAADLLGLTIPAAYGGRGADSLTYALCLLEMAKGCSATALTFNMHATVLTFIAALGSEEQQRRPVEVSLRGDRRHGDRARHPAGRRPRDSQGSAPGALAP